MSDLPRRMDIHVALRQDFQIEPAPSAAADKMRFCEALAETGLRDVRFVPPVDYFTNPRCPWEGRIGTLALGEAAGEGRAAFIVTRASVRRGR